MSNLSDAAKQERFINKLTSMSPAAQAVATRNEIIKTLSEPPKGEVRKPHRRRI